MKLDEFANQYFSGNMNEAIAQIAYEAYSRNFDYTKSYQTCESLLKQLNSEQEKIYVDYLAKEIKKNPKKFQKDINMTENIVNMNLTYEEIQNAKVNPYKAKIGKSFFKFLVGTGGILAFMIAANNLGQGDLATKLGAGAMTLFNSYVALDVTSNIMNYFKFKNAKKYVNVNEFQKNEIFEKGGKSL